MRRRRELRPDAQGHFTREIGWKVSRNGRLLQPKFFLGTNQQKAELANLRLEELWQIVESEFDAQEKEGSNTSDRPFWNEFTLELAKAIARGDTSFAVERNHYFEGKPDQVYFWFVQRFAQRFGSVMAIVADDNDAFALGREKELEFAAQIESHAAQIRAEAAENDGSVPAQTLHQAFDGYIEWIRQEFVAPDPATGAHMLTPWGLAQTKNVGRLKERHADKPLSEIDLTACEEMFRVWRQRPQVKGRKVRASTIIEGLLSTIIEGRMWRDALGKYRWPLLCAVVG